MKTRRRKRTLCLAAIAMVLTAGAASADLRESREIEGSFPIPAGGLLVVDNLHGSITVKGGSGRTVRMKVVETIEADDEDALERARREVSLLTSAEDDLVDLYVDGPFRDQETRGWSRRHSSRRYRVIYDFVLEVPSDIRLDVRTVTDGEIHASGVHGDFEVSNVNGAIEMEDLRGSGRIRTVNGPIVAEFGRSPESATSFETVNGRLEVTFPADLSADLVLDSRWGELWSEFEVVSLPVEPEVRTTRSGKTVLKIGGSLVRVAKGGPRLSFETLNGDVLIRKAR